MIFIYLLIVLLKIKYYHCYYTTDWRHDYYHYRQTPQDLMVDIINRFGFKLLAIHNENNNNNIAFSPYGAVSVLVALCEGVQGDGRNEIQYAINLPNDISITRIGLRDIHRHLKSYFIPEEGFLAGLILSHNNIELNREYVDILRFYGFDIESLNSSGLYPDFVTTTVTTTEIPTTTIKEETERTTITTTTTTIKEDTEATTTKTTIKEETEGTTITTTTTTIKEEIEATTAKTTIKDETEGTTITTTIKEEMVTTPITSTEIVETTTPLTTTTEMSEIITTPETTTTTTETSSTTIDSSTENVAETTTETTAATTTEDVNRRKRSVVDYLIARYYDEHTITQKPPSSMIINGKFDDESNINFMIYDTILPFFYFAHLETLALRFPLDNTRYYLLLLLPSSSTSNINGIDRLICDLQQTNLHYIIKNLKYTRVRAVIPSFMLKGFVVLTTTFQKLGIRKVFEPRHADFSPMTNDRDIYVTNIEQIITITIRNYLDGSKNRSDNYHLRYFHYQEPILFKVDRPFLYFVVDTDLHVTLMAGKIINPLNSRIK